jgi:Carbohydrate family 9 binding domain-like/Concanavalin A-like lectin/glucanases superfamily/Tetratricopeptide repeat
MKKLASLTISLLLVSAALTCTPARAASTSEMLQQGLYAEEVDGNINAAIKIYGQVIASSSASPNQAAQALYRQGMCYLKIKDDASARAALEKLVSNYPNQTDLIEKARPVLDELTDFDPAALMPPGTLVYVEFGSPGRQIETVLTMLKGTPFENPLAALGGGRQSNSGQKSPGDIVGALLNPSMMAEFKKIRGSAIGITGFAQNNPPIVSVLYPGRSDALRGLIIAGLGMAGSPGEPIEGMQTINLRGATASAAYDDTVIIFAQPASQLEWSVKQYKHTGSGPTLASSRGSFQKLDKNQRQKNAITYWADVGAVYGGLIKMLPPGNMPPEIIKANALFDFTNIDDLILTESIESNRLGLQAALQFKEGHGCLAYDLIRTPNLSKAALQAVPANAIALASFSLSQTDAAQSDKVRSQIQNLIGLDVGREVFANIEQVTIFALPGDDNLPAASRAQALLSHIGVAITSRNPALTSQLLTTVLGTLNAGQGDSTPGRFKIPLNGAQDLNCYLEQADNVTILSLNHDIASASASAITRHASVCDSGTLHDAVDRIAPGTSKLILVNVGGAMRLIGPQADVRSLSADDARKLNESFTQIARATDSTTLQVRTDEQRDSFTLDSEITGIPPLNEVFGPVTQYSSLLDHARAESNARNLREQVAATISPASRPPNIDGKMDDVWNSARPFKLANVLIESPSGKHATAEYRGLWDANNLYILVDVTDHTLHHDRNVAKYDTDGIEIYLDATDAKSTEFSDTDYEYDFNWDRTAPEMQEYKHGRTNGVRYALITTDEGYRLEAAFPWSTLGTKPAAGARIGLDVHVNDNQGNGKRDAKISWHDSEDQAWQSPRNFGNAELAGLVGWWKFDETQGTSARDSSGGNHDGTLIGHASWGKGRIGGAVALDGANSYVKIANPAAFNFSGQLTVATWVNIHSVPSEWMAIITKGDSAWRMSTVSQDHKIHFSVNHYDRSDGIRGSTDLTLNQWHHVAAVYNGDTLRLYIDGKLDSTQPWTGGIAQNDADVLIGENAEHTGRFFDGLIDDLRIYNYALSEGEITGLATGQ